MGDDRLKTSRGRWKAAWLGFAQAGAVVVLAAVIDRFLCPVTAPYSLLLLVVAYASFRGGIYQGLPCVGVMLAYALIHDSKPGDLFHYDLASQMRLLMSAGVPISIVVMMELLRRHYELRGRLEERAEAEAAMHGRQIEQQILFDSVPAMIWFKDKEGRILRANRPAAESLDRSVAEVEGRLTQELYPEQASKYQKDDQEVIESGRPKLGIVERYEIPTGEERWVRTDKLPYRDEEGKILGDIVFAVDITEQKRAEEALREARDELERRVLERTEELGKANENLRGQIAERQRGEDALQLSEARFRTMGETIAAAAFVFQGDKLLDANPAAERITGYKRDELVGQDFWRIIHPDHRELVRQRGTARQQGGNVPPGYEVKILRKDGTTRWVDFTAGMMAIDGRPAVLGTAYDITDRKEAEDALRDSEERFRSLFEQAATGIAYVSVDGRFLNVNRGFCEMLGYTREELLKLRLVDVTHPDHIEPDLEAIRGMLAGELRSHSREKRYLRKDGTPVWAHLTASLVRGHSNEPKYFVGVVKEIEEQKRVQEALRESEVRFRRIIETTQEGFGEIDITGRIISVNTRLNEIFGYAQGEMAGLHVVEDLCFPEDMSKLRERLQSRKEGKAESYDERFRAKSGEAIWVIISATPITNANGVVCGSFAMMTDISKRKHVQEALRESEEQLHAILDYTTAVIYVKDLDGKYMLVNRRYEELFHVTCEGVIGRTDYDLFPKDAADAFRANDRQVMEAGVAMELEEIVPQDDGVHFYISVKFPILGPDGKPRAVCGISTDITERKRDEGELRKAKDAAEEASRAKSQFLANISHEIRTPIMAMLGAAELVRAGDLGAARVRDRGEVILRNGRHLLALIDDLLAQSSLEAGRLEIITGECSLLEIMADVHALTSPLRSRRTVNYKMIYETSVPEWIVTDRKRLTQAIVNLVHNALKFTLRGFVRVRVRAERRDAETMLTVVVEDSGGGIAESDLKRIFEPFTQVGPVSISASAGVGLGLPLAKWIAERLDGRLEIASVIGSGSTFTLCVPVGPASSMEWIDPNKAAQLTPAPCVADASPGPPLRGSVLLAEDAEDVRGVMAEALERAGAEVVQVADGSAAIEAAKRRSFDLILLDIRMPVMDGFEAARQLRRDGCRSTLIALTASTTRSQREQILVAGFDDLWPKPISLERLVREAAAFLHAPDSVPSAGRSGAKPPGGSACEAGNDRLAAATAGFARSLPLRMSRLHAAIASGDSQEARDILHQLVGSAGMCGFMEVSQQAALVSAEMRKGGVSFDAAVYRRLKELVDSIAASVVADTAAVGDQPS